MSPLAAWVLIVMWGNTVPPVDQREAKAMISIDMPTEADCRAAADTAMYGLGEHEGFALCLPRFAATDKASTERPTWKELLTEQMKRDVDELAGMKQGGVNPSVPGLSGEHRWCRKGVCTDTKPLDWDSRK